MLGGVRHGDPRRDPRGGRQQARRAPDHRGRAPGAGSSGEFQRIALSATVRPLDARRPLGRRVRPSSRRGDGAVYQPPPRADRRRRARPSATSSRCASCAVAAPRRPGRRPRVPVGRARRRSSGAPCARNRSTLVFANSRRMVEKVTRLVNEDEADQLAYSHHGSLSREIRAVVEERLKAGRAARHRRHQLARARHRHRRARRGACWCRRRPRSASAVQRIGRAGHAVGETSRGGFCRFTRATCSTRRWWRARCSTARSRRSRPVAGAARRAGPGDRSR